MQLISNPLCLFFFIVAVAILYPIFAHLWLSQKHAVIHKLASILRYEP